MDGEAKVTNQAVLKAATPDSFFDIAETSLSLKALAVRGAAATIFGHALKFLLRFGATAVLARLLTPEDYGLVAMTAVITGAVGMFKDAGLAGATVQRERVTHDQISTLFWINGLLGCGVTTLLVAVSPLLAKFYAEPRIAPITCGLALSFAASGFTVQHQALLRRKMQHKTLASLAFLSMFGGVLIAVTMAALGFGYWSLVGLSVGTSIVNMVGSWIAMPWKPGVPRRYVGIRSFLGFGGDVLCFDVVNYFARQADNLLIGWYWGAVTLGIYDKAYSLLMLPIGQVNSPLAAVAVPALSRANVDPAKFNRFFLNAFQLLASATIPMVAVMAIFADQIVLLWLGEQWIQCAVLFQLLALAALVRAITNPVGWLLISLGHTRKYRQMGFANSAVIVASFVVGLPYGAKGVAVSYSIAMGLLFVPTWWFVTRGSTIRLKEVFAALAPATVATIPAAVVALAVQQAGVGNQTAWTNALLGGIVFGAAYSVILLVGFKKLPFYRSILRELKSSGPAKGHDESKV